uniref:ARAD1D07524p n=1 Tax=Blastobotrys adeninivorans TaxID=409370 RepID=A0A060T911_BLAAD
MVSDNLQWKINVIEAQLDENEPRLYKSKFAAQKEAKREADPEELRKQLVDLKQALGNRKIHHGRKILQKAIKQALKIESLKLSKRIKKTPEKEKKLAKEKEALDQLTNVDLGELMAAKLIQKTFLRTQKSLQNPPSFISTSTIEWTMAKQKELASLLTSAEVQNVYGRLGKVDGVRKASNDLLSSLNSVNKNVKRDEAKADEKSSRNDKSGSADKKEKKEIETKRDESESDSDNESGDNGDNDDETSDSEDEKSVDEVKGTEKSANESKKRKSSSQDDDDNDNEDDSDDESGDSESDNPDPFFLPTLATGYISGSDDEDDVDPNDSVVRQATSARKNRRGQRARQKIWEQKYGRRAKHIVKQKQENYEKQKAKQERQERREQKRLKMEEERKQVQQQKAKEFDSKPLHPSWEAKKKVSAPVKFEGKKMKFD